MSGEGEDYSDDEVNDLYDELADALEGAAGGGGGGGGGAAGGGAPGAAGGPSEGGKGTARLIVTAKVEWAGEYANNGRDGERTVRLNPINIKPIRDALASARRLEELAARGPLRSYNAKGWEAQLNQLGTRRGGDALKDAGFHPSPRTLKRWEAGTQKPSKANRERIREAYDNVRNPGRGVMQARRDVADRLTDALRDEYGSNVRFRDIRSIEIR
jgi:hypothetical protein